MTLEEVDNVDDSVVERNPEGVRRRQSVVDDKVISANNGDLSAFHQEHLLLVRVGRVERRVHSEPSELPVVLADDDEQSWDVSFSLLRTKCKLQSNFEAD